MSAAFLAAETERKSMSETTEKETFPAHTAVEVSVIPKCDICIHVENRTEPRDAAYDGATHMGPWANMCTGHFASHGRGLGLGRGQRLILAVSA